MKKQNLVVAALACALCLPIVGCGGQPAKGDAPAKNDAPAAEQSADFDANKAYAGQWHGSVAITGTSVYGTTGGSESMLDVYLEDDGTCSVEPVEAHADLLKDEGTWEGTPEQITLHLTDGDVVLTVVDDAVVEGQAADFGIADFDTISFDFYG